MLEYYIGKREHVITDFTPKQTPPELIQNLTTQKRHNDQGKDTLVPDLGWSESRVKVTNTSKL